MISVDELMNPLRETGIDALSKLKQSYLEGDGRVSVIAFDAAKPAF